MSAGGDRWRWADAQGTQHKVGADELRTALANGTLPSYTLVWRPGMAEWLPAHRAGELSAQGAAIAGAPVAAAPGAESADEEPPPVPLQKYAAMAVKMSGLIAPKGGRHAPPPPPPPAHMPHPPAAPTPPVQVVRVPQQPPTPRPPQVGAHAPPPPPPPPPAAAPPAPAPAAENVDSGWADDPPTTQMASPEPAAALDPPTLAGFAGSVAAPTPPPAEAAQAPAAAPPAAATPPPPGAGPPPPPPPALRKGTMLGIAPPAAFAATPPPPVAVATAADGEGAAAQAPPPDAGGLPSFKLDDDTGQVVAPQPLDDAPTAQVPPEVAAPGAYAGAPGAHGHHVAHGPQAQPQAPPIAAHVGPVVLHRPRGSWFLPAIAVGGGVVVLGMLGVLIGLLRGNKGSDVIAPSPPSSAALGEAPAAGSKPGAAAGSLAACKIAASPVRLGARAFKDAPIELLPAADGAHLYLGYAEDAHSAVGVSIETATLKSKTESRARSTGNVRGMIPLPTAKGITFVVDGDGKKDTLRGWRALSAEPPALLGFAAGALATAPKVTDTPTAVWPLGGDAPVEALRALAIADVGYAVAFRRSGGVYAGWLDAGRAARGSVSQIPGAGAPPGSPVGAPTVGWNHREMAIAFADRAAPSDPWNIRLGHAAPGAVPTATSAFTVPSGGPGGPTIAPALAGLADGRFLLAWTEGTGRDHDVRAQTLDADLKPLGEPFTVSAKGANAGQAAVAVENGHGVIAYLASSGKSYDVWTAGIECP